MKCTTVGKKPKICATSVIFEPLPKVNNRPIGETSPNLVTLLAFNAFTVQLQQHSRRGHTQVKAERVLGKFVDTIWNAALYRECSSYLVRHSLARIGWPSYG
jgi:hypothetical protein